MEETTVTIIGLIIAIIIMFMAPLIMIADRSDDLSQLIVQTATQEFVDDILKSGKITKQKYQRFVANLISSGNTYEINMEVKFLDENTSKVVTDSPNDLSKQGLSIGPNTYYSIFTSQVEDKIEITPDNPNGELILKQGDGISVKVKNNNITFSQALKSIYYTSRGESLHIITATASGTIAINGAT